MKGMWIAMSNAICFAMTLRAVGSTSFLDLRANGLKIEKETNPLVETTHANEGKAPTWDAASAQGHLRDLIHADEHFAEHVHLEPVLEPA